MLPYALCFKFVIVESPLHLLLLRRRTFPKAAPVRSHPQLRAVLVLAMAQPSRARHSPLRHLLPAFRGCPRSMPP